MADNMKKVMVIEDDDFKYERLEEALVGVLGMPSIIRAKSRNGGLSAIMRQYQQGDYFDLIVCDNYMPQLDDGYQMQPFARDIINYIRRRISKDATICVCSSEELDFDCQEHFIKWDYCMSKETLERELKHVLGIRVKS